MIEGVNLLVIVSRQSCVCVCVSVCECTCVYARVSVSGKLSIIVFATNIVLFNTSLFIFWCSVFELLSVEYKYTYIRAVS
jgi:hypothetical protein